MTRLDPVRLTFPHLTPPHIVRRYRLENGARLVVLSDRSVRGVTAFRVPVAAERKAAADVLRGERKAGRRVWRLVEAECCL